jgi:hypothetical protein
METLNYPVLKKLIWSHVKSMRVYYAFITGIAERIGIAFQQPTSISCNSDYSNDFFVRLARLLGQKIITYRKGREKLKANSNNGVTLP